jgi:zinc transport system ATP-binding protein
LSSEVVKFDRVWISYEPGVYVVEDASFTVLMGEFVTLVGPNGGGKTTILKAMIGLIKPDKGIIKLFGKDVKTFKEWKWIGYVPQHVEQRYASFPLSVEEFIHLKFPNQKILREDIEKMLEFVGLKDVKDKRISELSGGQLQRLYIARELLGSPKLLILDEPTSSIDPTFKTDLYDILREINEKNGTTIIMSTHDIAVISTYVKKIVCVNKRIFHFDSIEELMEGGGLCELYGRHVHGLRHIHLQS